MPRNRPYRLLARYYDTFFTFHREWFRRVRHRLLGQVIPRVDSACDLACGTGTTALELARRCATVYAIDHSPTMLELARRKARRAGVSIRFIHADMRTFRLPERVDLVISEYDSINHLPEKAHLTAVARAVARALRPGGFFCFDVNNRLAFQQIWPGTSLLEAAGVVLVLRGGYAPRADKGWMSAEWFLREKNCWRRFNERIEEVCWTRAEIRHCLRQAGFDWIRTWDATPFFRGHPRIRPGCRTFYLARKSRSLPTAS